VEHPRLLIVEDQEAIATQLRWGLSAEYEISAATSGKAALDLFETFQPNLVTLDLGLPPDAQGTSEGLRVLGELLRRDKHLKVIVITGAQDENAALEAIRLGAADFYHKPADIEGLKVVLRRSAFVQRLERENDARAQSAESANRYGRLLGSSVPMRELFAQTERVAKSNTTILILGESGTGKELVAESIHAASPRRDGTFVPINCAAIPHNLIESELFGHEKGAYTGAHTTRKGKIEFANGGTLFLDEIGELDLALQVKLLRFLQDHEVERVGGRERIPVDVRVVAATNADLTKMQAEGKFREDLFFRLSVVSLSVPPLRERGEDILLLANAFLRRDARDVTDRRIRGFSADAVQAMKVYSWPGNVRELENKVQRAVLVSAGPLLTPADLGLAPQTPKELTLRGARENVERQLVVEALLRTAGNVSRAAREIGVTRPTFHSLMSKYAIQPEAFRSTPEPHEPDESDGV
jgi:two-component system NtrC family response regulator